MSTGRLHFLDEATESNRHSMIHGSVTDKALLEGLIERCDVVFHLAAVLGVKNTVENPLKVIEGNIDGTRNVLELAMKYGAKVVFASTSEIYGKNSKLPFKEDSDRVLGDPSIHRWCYATAKAIDEHLCFAYAEQGLPVTVVRYFNAYGPRQTSSQYGGVVPRFIKAALASEPLEVHGDGSQIRCFTFIRDTVEGTVAAMEPAANGLAFNIGSERPIAIVDLAHRIVKLAGSSSPVVFIPHAQAYGPGFEDMAARIPDISRARRILQYEPSVSLEEGLQLSIDWYKRQQKAGG
ncbi:Bifunctional polymyxin resistance protein ArnA [Paenibacillus konkukensis]|uniref:Bifunctional polymyxin resistance protein ArnA n=2 Tax=Paenibacillus konkukensis TaxID=2020716 RepID=A0ABY4RWS0_9BACL|nr:Bifunctional polymyxin resistance protein ArnA [Paenibacillus konkukensis]